MLVIAYARWRTVGLRMTIFGEAIGWQWLRAKWVICSQRNERREGVAQEGVGWKGSGGRVNEDERDRTVQVSWVQDARARRRMQAIAAARQGTRIAVITSFEQSSMLFQHALPSLDQSALARTGNASWPGFLAVCGLFTQACACRPRCCPRCADVRQQAHRAHARCCAGHCMCSPCTK